jgi:dTDP-4-amino-4,6-dideoxygalactose transaminase
MNPKIYLSQPHVSGNEVDFIKKALDSNWLAPIGPSLDEFEKELQLFLLQFPNNKFKTPSLLALNSGTSAIHLGLRMLGVSKGDVVICQTFTFIASANPIVYLGAEPVFVDSESETWNMCPDKLEEAIIHLKSIDKKPKAIVTVHSYGMPYNVNRIHEIANKYNIKVLEDSAEAIGSRYDNISCGMFGDYSVFSFNGNKIITTSGGGVLVCKSKKLREESLYLATQAQDKHSHYSHTDIGYNYRMSNIIAAIGLGQISVLEDRIIARRKIFDFYKKNLGGLVTFLEEPLNCYSNRWLTCIIVKSQNVKNKIISDLKSENIESRTLWKPLHSQPIFKNNIAYLNGVSDDLYSRGLCLPSGSNLTETELLRIIKVIKKNVEFYNSIGLQ